MTGPASEGTTVRVELVAPGGFPLVEPGDRLVPALVACLDREGLRLRDGDIVVLAQKIVSKSEGRYVDLRSVTPGTAATRYAEICRKDPRLIELVLRESSAVMRCKPGVVIVRHRLGFVMANAGIDQSNIAAGPEGERALLLPADPDASAERLRAEIATATGREVGVAIIDSFGRAWRVGTTGTCIGSAGFATVDDLRGSTDMFGRTLVSSIVGTGDEVAAAASLLMGQSRERRPVAVLRGMGHLVGRPDRAAALIRPADEDLFP